MPEEPEQISRELTAQIVAGYLAGNKLEPSEIADVISAVHRALSEVGRPTEPVAERTPAVPIRRSVGPDLIACLECGYRGKTLKRHLSSRHGLSVEEYRARWNLKPDYPIVAPAYSARRSTLAKQLGLGRQRRQESEAPPAPRAKTRGRRRSKATWPAPRSDQRDDLTLRVGVAFDVTGRRLQ